MNVTTYYVGLQYYVPNASQTCQVRPAHWLLFCLVAAAELSYPVCAASRCYWPVRGPLALPQDHPETPRRDLSFFQEGSRRFMTRVGLGSRCIGRFGIPSSGNAAQSRNLPRGAIRSRSKVRPLFSHFTTAYYQKREMET